MARSDFVSEGLEMIASQRLFGGSAGETRPGVGWEPGARSCGRAIGRQEEAIRPVTTTRRMKRRIWVAEFSGAGGGVPEGWRSRGCGRGPPRFLSMGVTCSGGHWLHRRDETPPRGEGRSGRFDRGHGRHAGRELARGTISSARLFVRFDEELLAFVIDECIEPAEKISSDGSKGPGGNASEHLGDLDDLELVGSESDLAGLEFLDRSLLGAGGLAGIVGKADSALTEVHADIGGSGWIKGRKAAAGIEEEFTALPVCGDVDNEGVACGGEVERAVAHLVENIRKLGGLEVEDGVGFPEFEEELVGAAEIGRLDIEGLAVLVFDLVGLVVDAREDFQPEGLVSAGGGEYAEGTIILLFLVGIIVLGKSGESNPGKECEEEQAEEGGGHEILGKTVGRIRQGARGSLNF